MLEKIPLEKAHTPPASVVTCERLATVRKLVFTGAGTYRSDVSHVLTNFS
jgi:hypothetical protein